MADASNEAKGNDWFDKGEKKIRSFSLFNNGSKYEDAGDMFIKAANLFKMSKNWEKAALSFDRAADCNIKLGSKHEAASNYVNASICVKKINVAESIRYLKVAVELFTDEGRFSIAAKHQKEIAEMYEGELDYENSLQAYQSAAEFYDGEGSSSSAGSCLLKVAQLSAQLEKYERAIELYEQVAKTSLENNLLKWSVKEYFLRAGLCHLCSGDTVSARRAVEKYQEMDTSFSSQRECKFLEQLIADTENYDAEAFTAAVVDFDSVSKLDQWKTSILLRIKNSIKNEDTGLA